MNFFKNNNPYVLSSTLFLIATAMPIIPSETFLHHMVQQYFG